MMTHTYHQSRLIHDDNMWHGLIKATGALCPDGKRRTAWATYDGVADTFFSIPTFVYANHKRVYGYVTVETVGGSSVHTDDDPATVKFIPYLYRKHYREVSKVDPNNDGFGRD